MLAGSRLHLAKKKTEYVDLLQRSRRQLNQEQHFDLGNAISSIAEGTV